MAFSSSRSNWSEHEVEETARSYFEMLRKELAGERYNKTAYRNKLLSKIKRSDGSVEFKFQNFSAALIDKGLPYIDGYKPRGNYQKLVAEIINTYLEAYPEILSIIKTTIEDVPDNIIENVDYSNVLEPSPVPSLNLERSPDDQRSYQARKYDYSKREADNRKLGDKGEEFVVEYERHGLINAGREDLATNIERISETQGDGAGFDILSFDTKGAERYIEVKTTNFAKEYPFYISANELDFSTDFHEKYYLYRVFNFKKAPRLFILQGSLKEKYVITPTTFKVSY